MYELTVRHAMQTQRSRLGILLRMVEFSAVQSSTAYFGLGLTVTHRNSLPRYANLPSTSTFAVCVQPAVQRYLTRV